MIRMDDAELRSMAREAARSWWIFLITGGAWLILAWIILTPDVTSIGAISTLAGVVLLVGAVNEGITAVTLSGWRWLHALFAVLFLLGSTYALARPVDTFLALAAMLGWFLLFAGTFKIVAAFVQRGIFPLWWIGLVAGIIEVLVGFWAAGYPGRSSYLLIIWVGVIALSRGITQIVVAFELRSAKDQMEAA